MPKAKLQKIYEFQLGEESEDMTKEEMISGLMTVTAEHYWQNLLTHADSDFVSDHVPHYLEIYGYNQGDYAIIAFTDEAWYRKKFSWMTWKYLTQLFYDIP